MEPLIKALALIGVLTMLVFMIVIFAHRYYTTQFFIEFKITRIGSNGNYRVEQFIKNRNGNPTMRAKTLVEETWQAEEWMTEQRAKAIRMRNIPLKHIRTKDKIRFTN